MHLATVQSGLAWVAGGMMVLFGLAALGLGPRLLGGPIQSGGGRESLWKGLARRAQGLFAAVRELPGATPRSAGV